MLVCDATPVVSTAYWRLLAWGCVEERLEVTGNECKTLSLERKRNLAGQRWVGSLSEKSNARVELQGCEWRKFMRMPKASSLTTKAACSLGIPLILALSSCTKNAQQRPGAIYERDTIAEIQEPRNSPSASSTELKGVTPQKEISSDTMMQEKKSPLVDTLVGSVYVSGNEPFTRLTLALQDGKSSVFVEADSTQSKQLRKLQGRMVKVFGTIVRSETGDYIRVNEFVIVR